MNNATVSCDTTLLADGVSLYWQYNCDRIWLTLQNGKQEKFIIDEIDVAHYAYTYRLGFQLIKSFKHALLFRAGCSASGPCHYVLIDKNLGTVLKRLEQLICIDTDVQWENAHPYNFDFIVYLHEVSDFITVYYVDTKKTLQIPFKEHLNAAIPQYQFKKMNMAGNNLTLTYALDDNRLKTLKVNLADKKYAH